MINQAVNRSFVCLMEPAYLPQPFILKIKNILLFYIVIEMMLEAEERPTANEGGNGD